MNNETFPLIHALVPPGKSGTAEVTHFTITRDTMGARMFVRPDEYIQPGTYARLTIHGEVMMSDTPMERRSNLEFVRQAHGHVLIAGLGLGMIVFPLLERPKSEISSVTVIEANPDVIALVKPYLPDDTRLRIIQADIFEWKPDRKFATIYFDIWPTITTDNLEDMTKLHRRYARALDRTDVAPWMGSWQRELLLARRRRDQRERRRRGSSLVRRYW